MAQLTPATAASVNRRAKARRDAGLNRLSTATRSVGVATVVVAGLLAVYLGRAFPGHHATSSAAAPASAGTSVSAGTSASSTSTATSTGSASSAGTTGSTSQSITPATQPPARATTPPVVSSGVS